MLKLLKDIIQGKPAKKRSPLWRSVRAEHLKLHPTCAVCGGTSMIEVHHIFPFHKFPDMELNLENLITLCEGKKHCHKWVGHLFDWKNYNDEVVNDSQIWNAKLNDL